MGLKIAYQTEYQSVKKVSLTAMPWGEMPQSGRGGKFRSMDIFYFRVKVNRNRSEASGDKIKIWKFLFFSGAQANRKWRELQHLP
jgi:hypothetical protein